MNPLGVVKGTFSLFIHQLVYQYSHSGLFFGSRWEQTKHDTSNDNHCSSPTAVILHLFLPLHALHYAPVISHWSEIDKGEFFKLAKAQLRCRETLWLSQGRWYIAASSELQTHNSSLLEMKAMKKKYALISSNDELSEWCPHYLCAIIAYRKV